MRYLLFLLLTSLLGQCFDPPVENGTSGNADDPIGIITPCMNDVGSVETEPEPVDTVPRLVQVIRENIGIPPQDSIVAWLAFVSLPPNNPWCAAALSAWLHQAEVEEPLLRTGLARNYVYKTPERLHITAGRVLAGVETVPTGSLVVYGRGNTIFGHIGANTEEWEGQRGVYISGNTSPPGGAEATGGGVWEKEAVINPNAHLQITHFVTIFYEP